MFPGPVEDLAMQTQGTAQPLLAHTPSQGCSEDTGFLTEAHLVPSDHLRCHAEQYLPSIQHYHYCHSFYIPCSSTLSCAHVRSSRGLAGWQACMTGEAGQKGPTPLNPVQLHWPQEIARPAQLPAEKDGEISSLPHPHPKP